MNFMFDLKFIMYCINKRLHLLIFNLLQQLNCVVCGLFDLLFIGLLLGLLAMWFVDDSYFSFLVDC